MSIAETMKVFFISIKIFIISQMSNIRLRSDPSPLTQLSSSSSIDSASLAAIAVELNRKQLLLQWQNAAMAFCFESALEIAVLFAQTEFDLPVSFHILLFGILLTFLSLLVANFIGHNLTTITQVLEFVAVILASTTVVFTIAIPYTLSLKCVTWALYSISLLIALVCRYCF